MGISIKNERVEQLVRDYARAEGLGVTEAIAHAIRTARTIERREGAESPRREAASRYLRIAEHGWTSQESGWSRDELHDR